VSDTNELDRLRAEKKALDCLMGRHLGSTPLAAIHADVGNRIERLEAEAADPWEKAREAAKLHLANGGHNVKSVAKWAFHLEGKNAELQTELLCEQIDGGKVYADLKARIAELEQAVESERSEKNGLLIETALKRDEIAGLRRIIAELEARPVPLLDPKRVIATACKVIAHEDSFTSRHLMRLFDVGDAGIYPLAGDDQK
jgi:hypothetical protein